MHPSLHDDGVLHRFVCHLHACGTHVWCWPSLTNKYRRSCATYVMSACPRMGECIFDIYANVASLDDCIQSELQRSPPDEY